MKDDQMSKAGGVLTDDLLVMIDQETMIKVIHLAIE